MHHNIIEFETTFGRVKYHNILRFRYLKKSDASLASPETYSSLKGLLYKMYKIPKRKFVHKPNTSS